MERNIVTSDVLVIGGSGGGVMSAVSALREGASVVLVAKGKVGKSGNAIAFLRSSDNFGFITHLRVQNALICRKTKRADISAQINLLLKLFSKA